MSLSVHSRAAASRAFAILTVNVALLALLGCHHRASVGAKHPTERLTGGYGEDVSQGGSGSGRSVGPERLNRRAVGQAEELLEGRFPGVDVQRTASGGFLVRVRGVSTLRGTEHPLYVIDGTPVHVDPARGLDWLNPGDIARITVLRNPSETSLYGVRGANGVIVITTRLR
ncbi:MAG: TonB-dependent receptor plug domain-containing protein [Gemmatimonadota bacterium]|nr:TonB-dependent receptor plug domain-containing protein [Gemmatimonadota bacterium]